MNTSTNSEDFIRNAFDGAQGAKREQPRPLRRQPPAAEPFPIEKLGDILGGAATAVQEKTRAPAAICGNSVLAAATFTVQGFADVELPTGLRRPTSEYFVTIAETGERKSAADDEVLEPVREFEYELEVAYRSDFEAYQLNQEVWQRQHDQILHDRKNVSQQAKLGALKELGAAPDPPMRPLMLITEPTFEGLVKLLKEGRPTAGLFSDEGGQFIGGHAMSEEHRLKTAAALSRLWDGKAIDRVRAGDGYFILRGRRLSLHLLVQPRVADRFFGDETLSDQGILSRILAVQPEMAAGTRFWQEVDDDNFRRVRNFRSRITQILREPLSITPNGLNTRVIQLSADARRVWIEFADALEKQIGPDGALAPVRGLANKAPEHAVRISAVLSLFNDLTVEEIDWQVMADAVCIIQYYISEALRIRTESLVSIDIQQAEKLLKWLQSSWKEPNSYISLPEIYRLGPYSIRDQKTAAHIVQILVEHGWLDPLSEPAAVNGVSRRQVWRIRKAGEEI